MTRSMLRSVRFAFVSLLLALTVYTVLESALGGGRTSVAQAAEGLATCGSAEHPCLLEPVPAEHPEARLATSQPALGMTLRVRS